MKTEDLTKALALAKPCLGSANTVVPILSHFCFGKDSLYAYDDTVAIMLEFDSGLDCALHGDTLAALVGASGAEKVEFKQSDGIVQVKAGGGWAKLPSLSVKEQGQFTLPDETPTLSLALSEELLAGLQAVLVSVGDDSKNPEFAGITFHVADGKVTLLTTNNHTASRYVVEVRAAGKKAVSAVVPSKACEQILRLASAVKDEKDKPVKGKLWINERMALAEFGTVRLFSKVMSSNVKALADIFKLHADGGSYSEIPDKVSNEVAKACVVLGADSVKEATFEFSKDKVRIAASGALGQMESTVPCKGKLSGSVYIDPAFVSRVLAQVEKWRVNDEKSLAFSGGSFTYVISSAPKQG